MADTAAYIYTCRSVWLSWCFKACSSWLQENCDAVLIQKVINLFLYMYVKKLCKKNNPTVPPCIRTHSAGIFLM